MLVLPFSEPGYFFSFHTVIVRSDDLIYCLFNKEVPLSSITLLCFVSLSSATTRMISIPVRFAFVFRIHPILGFEVISMHLGLRFGSLHI